MPTVNYEGPKFSMGDLVFFCEEYVSTSLPGLGIIISEPQLLFRHQWPTKDGYPNEFWSYNVKVGNELFKMIPEQFLRGLKDEIQN